MSDRHVGSQLALLAGALAADGVSAEVVEALSRAGIEAVLVKGPTVASWLYVGGAVRGYSDSDVVVAPDDREPAADILRSLGFDEQPYDDPATSKHATPWVRHTDGAVVDLHHRLWGAWGPSAQEQWEILRNGWIERSRIGGREIAVPTKPARLMLVCLHASQHHDLDGKPLEDLRRALEVADLADWRRASILAEALGACEGMLDGLRRLPAGKRLAARLPLLEAVALAEPDRSRRIAWLRWSESRAANGSMAVIGKALGLGRDELRRRYPIARRGWAGLASAALLRLGHIARVAPRAAFRIGRGRP